MGDLLRFNRAEVDLWAKQEAAGDLDYLRPAVIVSVRTGLRRSELLRLKVDHINFGNASKF